MKIIPFPGQPEDPSYEAEVDETTAGVGPLTPLQLTSLIYAADYREGPVVLNRPAEGLDSVSIVRLVRLLVGHIDPEKGLKLTAAGYLPPRAAKDVYHSGGYGEELIDEGIAKLTGESSSQVIQMTRIIAELSGLIRKRKNVLYRTKKCEKLINSDELAVVLFEAWALKFNFGYFDAYSSEDIGKAGFNLILYLLAEYGDEYRPASFFGEKYVEVFHQFDEEEHHTSSCIFVRVFERFLKYFDLVEIQKNPWPEEDQVKKTPLFDEVIRFRW